MVLSYISAACALLASPLALQRAQDAERDREQRVLAQLEELKRARDRAKEREKAGGAWWGPGCGGLCVWGGGWMWGLGYGH